jgi:hypothetical protein
MGRFTGAPEEPLTAKDADKPAEDAEEADDIDLLLPEDCRVFVGEFASADTKACDLPCSAGFAFLFFAFLAVGCFFFLRWLRPSSDQA